MARNTSKVLSAVPETDSALGEDFLSLVEDNHNRPGGKCLVGILLDSLSATDREALQKALDTPRHTGAAIVRALNKNGLAKSVLGHDIGDSSIQRHRRRGCRCSKSGA